MPKGPGWPAAGVYVLCTLAPSFTWAQATYGPNSSVKITAEALDEVVVTGSRLPILANEELLPITVLGSADLARGGLDSLSTILQTLPMSATSVQNTNVNSNGDGSARVDLRGLQPWRTLVLLNGHRLPEGGIGADLSVDLNSIPLPMIERVEVLTGGASASYGADAIAGVVNLITKESFNGMELSAENSLTGHSDGRVTSTNLTLGRELFGGHWMLGLGYVNQAGVLQTRRSYSAQPMAILDTEGNIGPYGSLTIPEGVFDVPDGNALGLPPNVYVHASGKTGYGAKDYVPWDNNTFNYAPYAYLQTPNERASLWLIGTQPVSSAVSLHVEMLYNKRWSSQQLAPAPFNSVDGIPASNYYNPFGTDLDLVWRRFVELPARDFKQRVDLNREFASLSIKVGRWSIEPGVSAAHSGASQSNLAAVLSDRVNAAVGPSGRDAAGQIVCGMPGADGIVPAPAIIPGCVPVDLFGGVGSLTPQQIAYLSQTLTDHGTNAQQIASIDARGPWGSLPGGEVQWAAGVEYRRDTGSYIFDPNTGTGAVGGATPVNTPDVSIAAREAYTELRAPLLRQEPWASALDAAAGVRYSNYSAFGGHFTWQGGIRWQAVPAFTLRGNYSRVFRAPALGDLYVAPSVSQDYQRDPCGDHPTAIEKSHCAANGVPGGEYSQQSGVPFAVPTGGNPALGPEAGYSLDTGIDFRPAWPGHFNASLDYYQISLSHSIHLPSDADILQECADLGIAGVCSLIHRAPDGTIQSVSDLPINIGNEKVVGVDATVRAVVPVILGEIRLSLQGSYLARHDAQLFLGGQIFHEAGTESMYDGALPHWRSLAHADWDAGAWHLGYSTQWIGRYQLCSSLRTTGDPYCQRVAQVVYHDVEAGYVLASHLTLRIGINNFTDVQPPFVDFGSEANTDSSAYRLLGRTFFLALRLRLP